MVSTLLAIDCATDACSSALWIGGGPGPRRHSPMRRGHGEAIVPMIEAVMAEAGLEFPALDAIAVTIGPGAFTGLRIGLAAARGIALATGRPLIGVTTMETVAAAQDTGGRPLLVALGSRREDIYVQMFGADAEPRTEPRAMLPADAAILLPPGQPAALAGDAADEILAMLDGFDPPPVRLTGPDLPDAQDVARLAAGRAPPPVGDVPSPLYLRPPDAITAADRGAGRSP